MQKGPYTRQTLKLKCIGVMERPTATRFHFRGDVATAEWSSVKQYALTDGERVMLASQWGEVNSPLTENATYLFRNLVTKENKAFINPNTVIFKSYDLPVSENMLAKAAQLLYPPSPEVQLQDRRSPRLHWLNMHAPWDQSPSLVKCHQ